MAKCQAVGTQSPLALLIQDELLIRVSEAAVGLGFTNLDSMPWCRARATPIGRGLALSPIPAPCLLAVAALVCSCSAPSGDPFSPHSAS